MISLRYFTLSEFDQRYAPGSGNLMDEKFLLALDELRARCGFPLIVSSGYRSPAYNATISNTGEHGPHTTGKAADIKVYGDRAYALVSHASALGMTGIGISQRGERGSRFIHLDMLTKEEGFPRPWVWSY
jgi:uncharacterized protein YcbK (DUF882 family)